MYKPFKQMLSHWDRESTLVILGDLIDRGSQSLEVVREVMALKAQYGNNVLYLKGNHEDMFLRFLASPQIESRIYFASGGRETLRSFLSDVRVTLYPAHLNEIVERMNEQYKDEINFLKSGLHYKIIGNVLLTHAGFLSTEKDIAASDIDDFLWIRDHYLHPNPTEYVNVFGHTPVCFIHENKNNDVWVSPCERYIGIDGGCFFSGQLNVILISAEGELLQTFSVKDEVDK